MRKIFGVVAFAVGAAAGFFTGRFFYQEKYRKITEEEIALIKEHYRKKKNAPLSGTFSADSGSAISSVATPETKEPEAGAKAAPLAYRNYWKKADRYKSSDAEGEIQDGKPFIIKPDEFGTMVGYDAVTLVYYSDGTLADENDTIMGKEDIERAVGATAVNHFGEYEADSVFVRNPKYKCDYEITKDNRTYLDVVGEKPYILER